VQFVFWHCVPPVLFGTYCVSRSSRQGDVQQLHLLSITLLAANGRANDGQGEKFAK